MSVDQMLVENINKAFSVGDVDFIFDHIQEDIVHNQIGEPTLQGKEAFIKNMEPMRGVVADRYDVKHIFIDENTAIVEGEMSFTNENNDIKAYGFCDIFTFSSNKISKLTAFMIPLPQ